MIYKFYYPYYMSNPWKPNKPTQLPATNNSSQSNASKPLPPWMKNKG